MLTNKSSLNALNEALCSGSSTIVYCRQSKISDMIADFIAQFGGDKTLLVEPKDRTTSIDQVRSLRDLSYQRHKISSVTVIFKEAETLTKEAQNSLLKSLEEPPEGLKYCLVTNNADALLPTIKSRCNTVNLELLLQTEVITSLTGISQIDPAEAKKLVYGYFHDLDSIYALTSRKGLARKDQMLEQIERARDLLSANASGRIKILFKLDRQPMKDIIEIAYNMLEARTFKSETYQAQAATAEESFEHALLLLKGNTSTKLIACKLADSL